MIEHEEAVQSPDFKDRKTGLVVFGILQIILGVFCALMVPLMILGMIVSTATSEDAAEGVNLRMMIPGALFYVLVAVWFICIGIGSVKARRWARALILVSSWVWLVSGACGFVFILLFLPNMFDQMPENVEIPAAVVTVMKCVTLGFMSLFYVIIPGALVMFYKSRDVKATCEYRDTKIRWTDKCPLPVLGVSLICAFWMVSMLLMGAYGWAVPFFGVILSGISGAIVALVMASLLGYVAWGTYKLDMKAWWCALVVNVGWFLSSFITFSRVDMLTFYEQMGFPEQQLEIMKQYSMPWGYMSFIFGIWVIVILAYLLYIRKYFTGDSQQGLV
jgi:MFS family permease